MNRLFTEGNLRATLEGARMKMVAEIENYDANKLLNTAEDTLVDYFVSNYQVAPLEIAERDEAVVQVEPTHVDARDLPDRHVLDPSHPVPVAGTLIRVRVRYKGDPTFFRLAGSVFSSSPPIGEVSGSVIVYERRWGGTPGEDEVTRWVDEGISSIRQYASYQIEDMRQHNEQVYGTALQRIRERRAHLLASQNLQASLPFKMHPRKDAPLTFVPKEVKKRPITPPPASTAPYSPEPALSDDQFEDILRTARAIGHSMERTPGAYSSLGEEDLRSIILTSLNAQFEGGATGETFNVAGKTDILVRHDDRNLFIAECKIWDGPATLTAAIDQVLSYLAWRDTRVAVILFVRRKDFGAVLGKIPATVTEHPLYRSEVRQKGVSEWHYRFAQSGDQGRTVTLAVMAFHLLEATDNDEGDKI